MKYLATTLLALFATCLPVGAQDLGFAGSYGVGVLESNTTTSAWANWCNCDLRGTSLAQRVHVAVTMLLRNRESHFGAQASLGLSTGVAQFISPAYPAGRADMPADAALEFREQLRTIAFRAEAAGRISIGGEAAFVVGPWIESLLQSTLERTENVVAPSGALFPDATSERTIIERNPGDPQTVRWGVSSGFSISVDVGKGVNVVPHVMLQADLPGLADNHPGALLLTAGSAVVIDIGGLGSQSNDANTPLVLPDVEEPIDAVPPRPLSASIDVYAVYNRLHVQVADVRREITYRRIVAQMPRTIEVVLGIRSLERDYPLSHDMIDDIENRGSFVAYSPQQIDSLTLEIIATRMRTARDARVQLTAIRQSAESKADATARANAVRDYLVDKWSIDRRRFSVRDSIVDSEAASMVRIASSTPSILAPYVSEWLDEGFQLPSIGVAPFIDAPAGIRSSRLRMLRNGATLADTSLVSNGLIPEIAVDFSDAVSGGAIAPIVAQLDVVDSAGATIRATDELPLTLVAVAPPSGAEYNRERLQFVVDICRDGEPCADQEMLDELRRAIRPGAKLTIVQPPGLDTATQAPRLTTLDRVRHAAWERGASKVDDAEVESGLPVTRHCLIVEVEQAAAETR